MTKEEKKVLGRPGVSIFFILALCVVTSAASVYVYHNRILRPWETVTVDFRRLSDAKLGQLAERALAGQSTSVEELESFIQELQAQIFTRANGRTVFVTSSILSPQHDLTESIAEEMGIDLSKGLEVSLPGMASRIGGQLNRNMNSPARQ